MVVRRRRYSARWRAERQRDDDIALETSWRVGRRDAGAAGAQGIEGRNFAPRQQHTK